MESKILSFVRSSLCSFVIALILLMPSCATSVQIPQIDKSVQVDEQLEFIFDICLKLETYFYNQDAVIYPKLLNSALGGMVEELKKYGVRFTPENISETASKNEAKKQFAVKFKKALELAKTIENIREGEILFSAANSLLDSLDDSHTAFIKPEINIGLGKKEGEKSGYSGIGAMIRKLENDFYYVEYVIRGGPAEKFGLQRFDRIISIDNKAVGNNLKEIIYSIRGKRNTKVKFEIERKGSPMTIEIVRDNIFKAPNVEIDIFEDKSGKQSLGYLKMNEFSRMASDFSKGLIALLDSNVDGLILDLRGNPGGYLSTLKKILSDLLKKDVLFFTLKNKKRKTSYFSDGIFLTDLPLVVLIDNRSFSASEIAAAVLQEAGRATIVGEKSGKKVSVALNFSLNYGAKISITIYELFMPSGKKLEKVGVIPDVEIKLTKEDIINGNDAQLQKAKDILKEKISKK